MPHLLDEDHADFIQSGVSIIAASRDASNVPSMDRALGCKVSRDRRRVTIFVGIASAQRLLDDLRRCGQLAVVFSEPPTHRTIQLKADDAAIGRVSPADRKVVEAYADAMTRIIGAIGHREHLVRAMLGSPAGELASVTFTPMAAFAQTPGPRAGAPLKD